MKELEKEGVKALEIQADQADSARAANLAKKVGEYVGKIDILVNNAGIYLVGVRSMMLIIS